MSLDRLLPIEGVYLRLDKPNVSLHATGALVVDGPVDYERYLEHIADRVEYMPRMRRRVVDVPGRLGRPVWVEDPGFDVSRHVGRIALPSPGGRAELLSLMASLLEPKLDPAMPPWRAWVVEGLEGGRGALAFKMHHVIMDGLSATKSMFLFFDDQPEGWTKVPPAPTKPSDAAPLRLIGEALSDKAALARSMIAKRTKGAGPGSGPARSKMGSSSTMVNRLTAAKAALEPGPKLPFNAPVSLSRSCDYVTVSLSELRAACRALSATVNDVAISAIARAVGSWLADLGHDTTGLKLKVACPVAAHDSVGATDVGNFGSGPMIVAAPLDAASVRECVDAVRSSSTESKKTTRAPGGETLGVVPPTMIARGLEVLLKRGVVNMVLSNVPGPREEMTLQGHRIVELLPFALLLDYLGLICIVFSYADQISFGLTADPHLIDDLGHLRSRLEESLEEALTAAAPAGATSR